MVSRNVRNFGKIRDAVEIPDLVAIQRKGFEDFLQKDVAPTRRKCVGLEALFQEVFPIESYDKSMKLEYLCYELESPHYTPVQCRQLRLTYGYPLKIHCRLTTKNSADSTEQAIYLGEMPIMIGGGEFIINGAIRVIVNQLHRSPGVDFLIESKEGDRVLHGGRIIPERGSWIEIGVTHKDVLAVKIDQSSKIPATVFLRAIDPNCATTGAIIRLFYKTKNVPLDKLSPTMWAVEPIVDGETGEIIVKAGTQLSDKVSIVQDALSTQKVCKQITAIDEFFKIAQVHYVVVDHFNDPEGADEKGLDVFLKLLEGRAMFEYPDEKGIKKSKKDISFFNVDYPKGYKSREAFMEDWNHAAAQDEKLAEKFKELTTAPTCIAAKDVSKAPKKPGVYIFKIGSRVVYVGQAAYRKGKGLRDRLTYHVEGPNEVSSFHKHLEEFFANNTFPGSSRYSVKSKTGTKEAEKAKKSKTSAVEIEVIESPRDTMILTTLKEDDCQSHEQALLKFYMRLRPGNPPNEEKARAFFAEKFFDRNRYRLGKVGRFRLNRKFNQSVPEDEMTLRPEDFFNTMKYIAGLRNNEGEVDDIDHLGNRRLRTIDELAADEIRKGLLKLRKTVQERMSMKRDVEEPLRVADLVNSKSVSSSINYFFGRGELSQVVDQTNALSQLTHERRLSALGPGGLNRRRAGFEVRDVHISHYGRICPIETPEGTNIGLIASLAIFATIDEYGFLLTPYCKVQNGKLTGEVEYLRADDEMKAIFAPPSAVDPQSGKIHKGQVLAREKGELSHVDSGAVNYIDISPKQIVGISAALIPFLEHDDANRALMGSNMQRQAVPLLSAEPPLVGTGMEEVVGNNSSMVIRARNAGQVTQVDATRIVIDQTDEYELEKFVGLNERTCLNQKPIVKLGERVRKGQVIADGGGTSEGILSLGKNILVGFVSYDGFNFEDAIIVSERLCRDDSFTSIHIDEFTAEVRETRLGKEEFTADIPNVSERALRNLDEYGIVHEGTRVCTGDILVGKVVPKSKTELTPEEKLLHAIFGRAGEDVKNDSLELPSGYEGVVIKTERFTRRGAGSDEEKKVLTVQIKDYERQMRAKECVLFRQLIEAIHKKLEVNIIDPSTRQKVGASDDDEVIYEQIENFSIKWVRPAASRDDAQKIVDRFWVKIREVQEEKTRRIETLKHGDELPSGVLQMVKVYVAIKRSLSIGDKVAGRHGNKGVIAKIMPEEDMPFLEDGTPLDILLNPLGVPSRMNVGQILETHLGWVAKVLGFIAVTPVFDGATEAKIQELMAEANARVVQRRAELEEKRQVPPLDEFFVTIPKTLKTQLYDGRTGEPFDQQATIGYIYMMKLHHLVDDKIHARATGPYSLITQQPLGGKARTGGQRFGEMEVWALEGYGAAYTLQEMLTVKSDDVEGRTKIYESMVKGQNTLEAGTPLSFDVLCNEIRGLGLNIQLDKKRLGSDTL